MKVVGRSIFHIGGNFTLRLFVVKQRIFLIVWNRFGRIFERFLGFLLNFYVVFDFPVPLKA